MGNDNPQNFALRSTEAMTTYVGTNDNDEATTLDDARYGLEDGDFIVGGGGGAATAVSNPRSRAARSLCLDAHQEFSAS